MSLSNYYYYEPFFSFSDINRLFDDAFGSVDWPSRGSQRGGYRQVVQRSNSSSFMPRIDVHESAENNLVTATFELPGLKKEDVNIDLQKNHLVVSGESNVSNEKEENGFVVKERRRGRFSRTIPLPSGTKPENIKAAMENGILSVTYPKTTEEQATKRITIA